MISSSIQLSGLNGTGYESASAFKPGLEDEIRQTFASLMETADKRSAVNARDVYDTRLPGDYISELGTENGYCDKDSRPVGFAANSAAKDPEHARKSVIDRNDVLYKKALELESYIVKIMLTSMRSSGGGGLYGESYAARMYEDMLYDELAGAMTKNAGFGLADQVYLQLRG